MSDFFGRLAMRALGRADTVRPVLAPLTAPSPAEPPWWDSEAEHLAHNSYSDSSQARRGEPSRAPELAFQPESPEPAPAQRQARAPEIFSPARAPARDSMAAVRSSREVATSTPLEPIFAAAETRVTIDSGEGTGAPVALPRVASPLERAGTAAPLERDDFIARPLERAGTAAPLEPRRIAADAGPAPALEPTKARVETRSAARDRASFVRDLESSQVALPEDEPTAEIGAPPGRTVTPLVVRAPDPAEAPRVRAAEVEPEAPRPGRRRATAAPAAHGAPPLEAQELAEAGTQLPAPAGDRARAVSASMGPQAAPNPSALHALAAPVGPRAPRALPALAPRGALVPAPEAAPGSAAPPVVRITIGRIEVRAPAPTTPRAEPRAPERDPRMIALQDYMKQRGGGGS